MWNDPLTGSMNIPGELEIFTEGGVSVAHVVHSPGTGDAYVQDAHRVNVGSLHTVGSTTYERDASGINQGSFQNLADGSTSHHTVGGLIDYKIDQVGRVHDASGLIRGSFDVMPGGRVAYQRHIADRVPDGADGIAPDKVPEQRAHPRRPLSNWKPELVQHDLDRQATDALKQLPGLGLLAKKFQEYGASRAEAVTLMGSGLRVSERQLAPLYRIYRETAEVLGMTSPPKLYVMPGGMNAYTFEAQEMYVVLNSGLVSSFNEAELRFTLGHELGHVLFGHVRYTLMAAEVRVVLELLSQATLGIGGLVGRGIEAALLAWARKSELSSDRVGVLAVQDSGTAAMTALMKMSGAPFRFYGELDLGAFLEQARAFERLEDDAVSGIYKFISTAGRDHPWSVARASELLRWIEGGGVACAIDGVPFAARQKPNPTVGDEGIAADRTSPDASGV